MTESPASTKPEYRCRMDWGRRGARRAAERGDIIVVVDVLSFSTVVTTALHHGGLIYPCTRDEDVRAMATRIGGEAAVRRREVPDKGRYSLSPLTYMNIKPGTKVAVYSPNGATCSRLAHQASYVFVAGLINAKAVAEAIAGVMRESDKAVTVIACGEREKEPNEDGPIRWAVEDYLGAGAVLSYLPGGKSPDAVVCESAFVSNREKLDQVLSECPSGIELKSWGFAPDVEFSARLNLYNCVPVMRDDHFDHFRAE